MRVPGNLLTDLPADLSGEVVQLLLRAPGVRVERIVSHGQASPAGFWYGQAEREWVVVLRGAGRVRFEDGRVVEMRAGDWLDIPAGARHRVEWTAADEVTVWLAVFVGTHNDD
ncbi:MAG TPA: cupin domain-containing protein [Tepidisphaeraceae bacterium]|nr:cupin domain-containing protein [Tepidisphaeraceae bacterium]